MNVNLKIILEARGDEDDGYRAGSNFSYHHYGHVCFKVAAAANVYNANVQCTACATRDGCQKKDQVNYNTHKYIQCFSFHNDVTKQKIGFDFTNLNTLQI